MENNFDVIIIGAGAAGLMAAVELCEQGKKIAVIEARNRAGGRIDTITDERFEQAIELGAEFIHGNLPITKELLQKGGIKWRPTAGEFWTKEEKGWTQDDEPSEDVALQKAFNSLAHDLPVAEFLNTYLNNQSETAASLKGYVEGYNAADITTASTFALQHDLKSGDEEQYRPEGGYKQLVEYLLNKLIEQGVTVFYASPIKEIKWQKNAVTVISKTKTWTAGKVIITVPVSVLKKEIIRLSPAIPEVEKAIANIGFGNVIKIIFSFSERFWENKNYTGGVDLRGAGFIFSNAKVPTWWTQLPAKIPVLTGWLAGPKADAVKEATDEEIKNLALQSLSQIFTIDISTLQQLIKGWKVANWANDPFSYGGYSFKTVNDDEHKNSLKQSIENTVFFRRRSIIHRARSWYCRSSAFFRKRNGAKNSSIFLSWYGFFIIAS